MKKEIKPTIINRGAFTAQRQVSFFLRIHRHLPDEVCGGSPIGHCYYREDGDPINALNDYVEKLQKDPDFREKEKEVERAQIEGKKLFTNPSLEKLF